MFCYLRALVLHPQVDADEGVGADDVGARVVGRAVPLEVPGHGGLPPLGSVERGRQRQVLALQAHVVHAPLGVVRVHLERAHARVLGLAASVHALLLVHGHHLGGKRSGMNWV